jgi:hypothetical protein
MDNQKRQHAQQLNEEKATFQEIYEKEYKAKREAAGEREAAQRELVHQREDHHGQVQ